MQIRLKPDIKQASLTFFLAVVLLLSGYAPKAQAAADPLEEALAKSIAELQWSYISLLAPASSIEVLEWKALMSEGRYQIAKNEFDRFDVILEYERLINKRCLGRLPFDLEYTPANQSKECPELVEKLLEFDPDNAPALCVRDGVQAASCRDAYLRSIIWTMTDLTTTKKGNDWGNYIKKISERSAEIRASLPTNLQTMAISTRYEHLKKDNLLSYLTLQQSYAKLLSHTCQPLAQITITRAEALGEKKATPTPTAASSFYQNPNLEPQRPKNTVGKKDSKDKSPMEEVLESLNNPDVGEDSLLARLPPEANQIRAKIISFDCANQLDQLFKGDKNSPLLACARDGLYSTFCLDALQRDRKVLQKYKAQAMNTGHPTNPSAEAPPAPTLQSGLAEF